MLEEIKKSAADHNVAASGVIWRAGTSPWQLLDGRGTSCAAGL